LVTDEEIVGHIRSTQVQESVFEPNLFVRADVCLNHERKRRCLRQYAHGTGDHLDGTGRYIRVWARPSDDFAFYLDDVLEPHTGRGRPYFVCRSLIAGDLYKTVPIPQVDKGQTAEITNPTSPTL
jgi:hypothetical protein